MPDDEQTPVLDTERAEYEKRVARLQELRGSVHAIPEVLPAEHSPDAYNRLARAVNTLLDASGLLYVAPPVDESA